MNFKEVEITKIEFDIEEYLGAVDRVATVSYRACYEGNVLKGKMKASAKIIENMSLSEMRVKIGENILEMLMKS